jgi:hypothetical protein
VLIQVVPQLKPTRCGVSDQAMLLAGELKAAFGIDTAFAILNSDERCDLPYPMIHCPPRQLLENCRALSGDRSAALLVHLSGYGYSFDGAPALLADALDAVRADGRFRSAVYFHELFTTGMPPWKSAYWYSRRQRNAVRRIAEGCDLLVTSSGFQAEWLEREPAKRSAVPVKLLPVFSAVGEAAQLVPVAQRKPALAVFGLSGTRQRAYKALAPLGAMLHGLGIEKILDIGPDFDAPADLSGIPVERMGPLDAKALAGTFSQLTFGFVPHGPLSLTKSSVCASFCSQGAIPVIADEFNGVIDGIEEGVQVIGPRTVEVARARGLESCSQAAWNWYSQHSLRAHAAFYRDWLTESK